MTSQVMERPTPSGEGARAPTFFGEPMGIAFLAFTEAWERFSYYGMTALLVLYMSQQLLLPGHVEHIAGFGPFRAAVEAMFGHLSPIALASTIFGLYTGFVYFTPVFGGLIADRWIGRRPAVLAGGVLMSAGHIAMAFDVSFLLALLLLVVGCGLLKGNISAQVGGLYRDGDDEGRTRGFTIFSTGINVGAVVGPLACGLLAQIWGWHAGFALAGVLMLLGLVTYLAGYRYLPEGRASGPDRTAKPPLTARQWRVVLLLLVAMATTIPQSIIYSQNTNICLIWINQHVDLNLLGFHVPVAWFNSIDSGVSIVVVPLLFAIWRWQAKRGGEPGELGKIATGVWLATGANLLLVAACLISPRPSVLAPVVYDVILGVAFMYYWPTLLALVSRASPPQVRATMMGLAFTSSFIADILIGWLGQFYEKMSPAAFWGVHVAIGVGGGLVLLLLSRPLDRVFETERGGD
jgi:POT family proton-dependent oligopeptide transporter